MKIILYGEPVLSFETLLSEKLGRDFQVTAIKYSEIERLNFEIKDTTVLITVRFNNEIVMSESLKLVQCPGIGYDEIDLDTIPRGAYFCNVGEHENGVAEFVLLALLALNWKIINMHNQFVCNNWIYSSRMGATPSVELKNKKVGIIGYGNIGRSITKKLMVLDVNVCVCSRQVGDENYDIAYYTYDDIIDMVRDVDYLVVACDVRKDTVGFVNIDILRSMKRSAYLINVARACIVKEEDLYLALKNKFIAGAFIDVWYHYPTVDNKDAKPSKYPFGELDNIYMTPHVAGWTQETVENRWNLICNNIAAITNGLEPKNIIKAPE